MKRDFLICLLLILGAAGLLSGCGKDSGEQTGTENYSEESQKSRTEEEGAVREGNGKESRDKNAVRVTPTSEITELEKGLSVVRYEGEYGFDTFLEHFTAGTGNSHGRSSLRMQHPVGGKSGWRIPVRKKF